MGAIHYVFLNVLYRLKLDRDHDEGLKVMVRGVGHCCGVM